MSFDRFLADLKQQAVAEGVSQRALAEAAPYLVYDQSIVNRDRGQRVFGQVFTEFARNRASEGAAKNAQARIRMHAAAFNRAEKEYGVPPAVIAAFWGLESSFGAELGKLHTLPSLVSLAYDCRRSEMFQKETIAALKIIDRGDLSASEMIGSWAGELGQTQFLPTHYFNYAVDYDGDGHRNLLSSVPDVIGSTANYIANGLKWRRGEPWLQEVRAPQNLLQVFLGTRPTSRSSCRARNGRRSASPIPTASRCRMTICRPRCCCRWAAPDRRFWPMRISPPTPNGTTR